MTLQLGDTGITLLKACLVIPIPVLPAYCCPLQNKSEHVLSHLRCCFQIRFADCIMTKLLTTILSVFQNQTTTKHSGFHSNSWDIFLSSLPPSFRITSSSLEKLGPLSQLFVFAFADSPFPFPQFCPSFNVTCLPTSDSPQLQPKFIASTFVLVQQIV